MELEKDHSPHQIGLDLLGIPFALGGSKADHRGGARGSLREGRRPQPLGV